MSAVRTVALLILLILIVSSPAAAVVEAKPSETEPVTSPLNIPDNEIYLITPGLRHILTRYRAGEQFEFLPDLEKELKKRPQYPSTHYMVGSRKLLFKMLDPEVDAYDKDIIRHFEDCVLRAERIRKMEKYKHAAMFYEATCRAGLGAIHVMLEDYLEAGLNARTAVKLFFSLLKLRPDHHGTLFAVGAYNYYTARMGTLGKVLLSLIGLPMGDRELGLKQLMRASENGGPFDIIGKFTLAPALADFEHKPEAAIAMARDLVRLIPMNPAAYLELSYQYMMAGRLIEAEAAMAGVRKYQLPDSENSTNPEIRSQAVVANIIESAIKIVLRRDEASLQTLYSYCKKRKGLSRGIPQVASLSVGHLFKLAGYDEKANEMYEWVEDSEGSRWIRDRAKEFRKELDINEQVKLKPAEKEALREFMKDKALPDRGES